MSEPIEPEDIYKGLKEEGLPVKRILWAQDASEDNEIELEDSYYVQIVPYMYPELYFVHRTEETPDNVISNEIASAQTFDELVNILRDEIK